MSVRARFHCLLLLSGLALLASGCGPAAEAAKSTEAKKAPVAKVYEHVELGPESLAYLVGSTSVGCTASCSDGAATPLTCSASGSGASCTQSKDGRTATCEDDDGTMFCDCTATPRACSTGV